MPQLSVMVGLLLGLCSTAVLIYFIHPVPRSIHINTVVARIGEQLIESLAKRFPANIGERPESYELGEAVSADAERALATGVGVAKVCAHANGYIEAVDDEELMEAACRASYETMTNGYNMFNATLCYRLNVGLRKSVELYARGTNLANELAFSHTSFVKINRRFVGGTSFLECATSSEVGWN